MRLKWLSLVHQQGCEKTVKSAHFHENSNFHKCSYTQCICSWGIWESTGAPIETGHLLLSWLLTADPNVQINFFRWEKPDLLNTFSSQIETMPSLFKQSRYSTREGIKL